MTLVGKIETQTLNTVRFSTAITKFTKTCVEMFDITDHYLSEYITCRYWGFIFLSGNLSKGFSL